MYAAELTGVSAYLGAIPLFNPAKTYLSVAAAILGTEARHTAFLAATLNGPPFNLAGALKTAPLANENSGRDTPLTPDQVLNQGGTILAPDNTVAGDGAIGPISGPKGFGARASCSSELETIAEPNQSGLLQSEAGRIFCAGSVSAEESAITAPTVHAWYVCRGRAQQIKTIIF